MNIFKSLNQDAKNVVNTEPTDWISLLNCDPNNALLSLFDLEKKKQNILAVGLHQTQIVI